MDYNWLKNRKQWRDDYDLNRQLNISRESDYERYYPYPAFDDNYRMYRDWNDSTHYSTNPYAHPDENARAGYMEFSEPDDLNRARISAYGYRNVGDRANYGHSGTNDEYDPRYYDRGNNIYGLGADTYTNARRDEEMRYDSANDWYMHGRDIDPGRDMRHGDEKIASIHYDSGINERNTGRRMSDHPLYKRED